MGRLRACSRACRRPFPSSPQTLLPSRPWDSGCSSLPARAGHGGRRRRWLWILLPAAQCGVRPDAWDFTASQHHHRHGGNKQTRRVDAEVWKHLVSLSARWAPNLRVPCAAVNIVVECRGRGVNRYFAGALREGGQGCEGCAGFPHCRDELFHPSWSSPTPPWAYAPGALAAD